MKSYDKLMDLAGRMGYKVYESFHFSSDLKGLACNDKILLSDEIVDPRERTCILAEELAHATINYGDIVDQRIPENRRQEKKARAKASALLVPWEDLFEAVIFLKDEADISSVADYLEVTPEFLEETIDVYARKYGPVKYCGEYIVFFSPFRIVEKSRYYNQ